MRPHYIVSGILLILDFAVAVPVPVQKKLQSRVDVVHIPKAMFERRGSPVDKVLNDIFGDTGDHFVRPESPEDLAKPEKSSATRPSSSSQPSGLADGSVPVEEPLPSISKEPSQMSSLDIAPLSADDSHGLMKMWLDIIGHPESAIPGESSTSRPSSISEPSGPVDGSTAVEKQLPSISKEPSQVPVGFGNAPLSANNGMMNEWLDLIGYPESPAIRPLSNSQSPVPADGSMAVKKLPLSISKGSSQVPNPDRAPLTANNGMMKEWLDPNSHPESSATRLLSSSQPPVLADGSMAVKKPLLSTSKGPSQVPSPDRAPLTANNGMMKEWLDLNSYPESSATRPLSSSQPSGLADGSMAVKKPLSFISKVPSQVSSPKPARLSANDKLKKMWLSTIRHPLFKSAKLEESPLLSISIDAEPPESPVHSPDRTPLSADDLRGLTKMWLDIIGHPKSTTPEGSSAARPLSGSPSGPADGGTDVEQPPLSIPEETSPMSSPDQTLPGPGLSTGKRKRP